MLSRILKHSLVVALLAAPFAGQAQYTCADYHKFNCERSTDKRFSMNGQSKSAMVQVGKETELNVIVYRGQDYRIIICHDRKVLGEALAIRLVEKVRVPVGPATADSTKRVYEEVEKVLWDNTEHDMVQEVEFSCTATKRIAVEVNAPGATDKKGRKPDVDIACVGILIEHMPTPGLGF
jgi:hypothetical protein